MEAAGLVKSTMIRARLRELLSDMTPRRTANGNGCENCASGCGRQFNRPKIGKGAEPEDRADGASIKAIAR
jgi:hypothetical protein